MCLFCHLDLGIYPTEQVVFVVTSDQCVDIDEMGDERAQTLGRERECRGDISFTEEHLPCWPSFRFERKGIGANYRSTVSLRRIRVAPSMKC